MGGKKQPGWRVVAARFETSAPSVDACPPAGLPEVAFAGRSNVGKSSLLNAFAGRRGLARTSRTPGRTQLLNCFEVELQSPTGESLGLRCMDLPGYGYAATDRETHRGFGPMVEGYIAHRETLRGLVLLVDARRGLGDLDLGLLQLMTERGLPTLVVATKADKLGAADRGLVARRIAEELGVGPADVLLTSAREGWGVADDPRRGGLVRDVAQLAFGERSEL